jgi:GNAT superfamily N-acetyltransferase
MDDLTEGELARYCEAMLYDYEPEWRPPGIVEIDRPDVLAWKRPGWPAWASRVAYAKWDEETADAGIDELMRFFGDVGFNWHVGPSSSPSDLAERLVRHGLTIAARPRMMTIAVPLPPSWPNNRTVQIEDVVDERTARISLTLAHHTGDDLERSLAERLAYLRLPSRRGGYLIASLDGVPVANAGYRHSSDGRCVYLTGAETVEGFRGRGVYKALIAYRAAAAVRRGCEVAAILANSETSAPILRRHGFADHGELPRVVPAETARGSAAVF